MVKKGKVKSNSKVVKAKRSVKRVTIPEPAPITGELPELPDFSEFSAPAPQEPLDTPAPPAIDEPQKKRWFSWLLPKKTETPALEGPDLTAESASESFKPTPESTGTQQAESDQAVSRAYDDVTALHTRLDSEMREKQAAIAEHHERNKVKEEELEKWHDDLLSREKEIVKKEKEYEKIKKLEAELEDKEITLKHKEEEVEELKDKLAEKELELTQKEAALEQMAKKLDVAQEQQRISQRAPSAVSDDYHKLKRKGTSHAKLSPRHVLAQSPRTVDSPAKREIRTMLLKAYDQLSANNLVELQATYTQIREAYGKMILTTGQDEQLYKDIMDLYNDIKLAIVQRS